MILAKGQEQGSVFPTDQRDLTPWSPCCRLQACVAVPPTALTCLRPEVPPCGRLMTRQTWGHRVQPSLQQ